MNGKTYLDLGNDNWEVVEISADGWRVITNPPIKFQQPKGLLPLPTPQQGGSIDLLKKFVSTGGGYSCRELYGNGEEHIFDVQRPAMLTGINNPVKRSDLLDRALLIDLPVISEGDRRPERDLWAEFEVVRPLIIGALCDGVSAAIRNLPNTELKSLPRMADFALWGCAAESAFGWPAGSFLEAYEHNRRSADELALESPLAQAVISFMVDKHDWEGTATELLGQLNSRVDEMTRTRPEWARTGSALSGQLKELAPNLRAAGIDFERGRDGKKRSISLVKR